MENKIFLKINKEEILFSCEGYSEEFINSISEAINQARRQGLENRRQAELERRVPEKTDAENSNEAAAPKLGHNSSRKDDTQQHMHIAAGLSDNDKSKMKKKNKAFILREDEEKIIGDMRAGMKFKDAVQKYGITSIAFARYARILKNRDGNKLGDASGREGKETGGISSSPSGKTLVPVDINSGFAEADKGVLLSKNPAMAQWQLQQMAKGN